MFPSRDEIKKAAEIELQYMLKHGYTHGEIDLQFPHYGVKMVVFVRQGKMEYASITEHPKGIRPKISLLEEK